MAKKARYPVEDRVKRKFRHTRIKNDIPPIKKLPEPLWDNNKKLAKSEDTLSERFHKYYRWNTKYKKKITLSRYKKFLKKFFKQVMLHLINNKSGVFIENFGYFFMHMRPKTIRVVRKRKPNIFNKSEVYLPMFFPIRKDAALNQWTMDRMFSRGIKERLNRKVNTEKVIYKSSLTNLIAFYGNGGIIIPNIKKKNIDTI
jgi:hypothetical protein